MIKLNILAFTLMIQIRKKNVIEIEHEQRLREINDQNLDRRARIFPYM